MRRSDLLCVPLGPGVGGPCYAIEPALVHSPTTAVVHEVVRLVRPANRDRLASCT